MFSCTLLGQLPFPVILYFYSNTVSITPLFTRQLRTYNPMQQDLEEYYLLETVTALVPNLLHVRPTP